MLKNLKLQNDATIKELNNNWKNEKSEIINSFDSEKANIKSAYEQQIETIKQDYGETIKGKDNYINELESNEIN